MKERPPSINEHAAVPLDHIANVQKALNTCKPPAKIILRTLKVEKHYIERARKEPSNYDVMSKFDTLEKAAEKHTTQGNAIADHMIIMKNPQPNNTSSTISKPSRAFLMGGAPLPKTKSHMQP